MPPAETPWSIPLRVDDVSEQGRHYKVSAEPAIRAAVARLAGLVELSRLEADLDVTRRGRDGLRVEGVVCATATQTCVVSLDPLIAEINEPVDVTFSANAAETEPPAEPERLSVLDAPDPPERLIDGTVDLGALAVEFLLLGLDPYPRKPDAVLETPAPAGDETDVGPFAALAALKNAAGAKK
jgi:hypothetical protein